MVEYHPSVMALRRIGALAHVEPAEALSRRENRSKRRGRRAVSGLRRRMDRSIIRGRWRCSSVRPRRPGPNDWQSVTMGPDRHYRFFGTSHSSSTRGRHLFRTTSVATAPLLFELLDPMVLIGFYLA
jgi:hypothetical protein